MAGHPIAPANIMRAHTTAPNHFRQNVSCGVNTLEGPTRSQSECVISLNIAMMRVFVKLASVRLGTRSVAKLSYCVRSSLRVAPLILDRVVKRLRRRSNRITRHCFSKAYFMRLRNITPAPSFSSAPRALPNGSSLYETFPKRPGVLTGVERDNEASSVAGVFRPHLTGIVCFR